MSFCQVVVDESYLKGMQITNTTVTGYISFMESVRFNIYNDYYILK